MTYSNIIRNNVFAVNPIMDMRQLLMIISTELQHYINFTAISYQQIQNQLKGWPPIINPNKVFPSLVGRMIFSSHSEDQYHECWDEALHKMFPLMLTSSRITQNGFGLEFTNFDIDVQTSTFTIFTTGTYWYLLLVESESYHYCHT